MSGEDWFQLKEKFGCCVCFALKINICCFQVGDTINSTGLHRVAQSTVNLFYYAANPVLPCATLQFSMTPLKARLLTQISNTDSWNNFLINSENVPSWESIGSTSTWQISYIGSLQKKLSHKLKSTNRRCPKSHIVQTLECSSAV
jgi:hypothetical protein